MPKKTSKPDPLAVARNALSGEVLDLAALETAQAGLDPSDRIQNRARMLLGNILSIVRDTRSVSGAPE